MPKTLKAHLALFLVTLIFSANYTIAKEVMDKDHIRPLAFISMRIGCAMILFWFFHLLLVREKVARKDLGRLLLCGLIGIAINQMFFFSGLKWTTPINAAVIITSTPIHVLIFSAIVLRERITNRKILGILLGAAGAIMLIVYGKTVSFGQQQFWGNIMIFTNATFYALYLVLVKSMMEKYLPITVMKWVFAFGFLFALPFGMRDLTIIQWAAFSVWIWLAVAYVLICTTFLAYLLNAFALKIVSPAQVSIYVYLQPLLATLVALLAEKDTLEPVKLLAAGFIFTGVYLVITKPKPRG